MSNTDNKQLVQRWFEEVWNQGRESTIDELLAPGAIGFGLAATDTKIHGAPEFKPFVRNFRDAFPDMHFVIEDMLAEGDKVAVRLRVSGTHKGGGLGVAPTGRKIEITAISIIEFANGKLFHGWNCWDQLGMMQQLGMARGPMNMDQLLEKRS
jgi:steroid delta-isomerase-like uncharacterized protein